MTVDVNSHRDISARRLAHIDCLRALAAILVAFHHFFGASLDAANVHTVPTEIIRRIIYGYLDLGRTGVLLFFVISGYCIANSILRPHRHPIAAFVLNRIARIYPAYWLSLIGVVMILETPSAKDIVINVLLLQKFLGRPDILGLYWTLAVELTFYGFCVVLFVLGLMGSRLRLQIIWCLLIAYCVIAALTRTLISIPLPYAIPWFLALMVGGAVLRRIDDERMIDVRCVRWGAVVVLTAALVIALCIYGDPLMYDKTWIQDFSANALAIGLFLGCNYIYRFSIPAVVYLGRISYSIYLFHSLIFIFVHRASPGSFAGSGMTGAAMMMGISFFSTIAVASFTYRFIESPGIWLGRRASAMLEAPISRVGIRSPDLPNG